MKHLGDITKLHGDEVEIVDCICGGSPCQDLSVAGRRAGLAGARSGLFMEQIRVIKEMREHDKRNGRTGKSVRPRFTVWENVPGALSSNNGKDFAAVLEETIRVIEPEAPALDVPKQGWPNAGAILSDDGTWSVAWRILDAQFWGVPQRRRRIALVADYGGLSAPKIVFKCDTRGTTGPEVLSVGESVSGDPDESCESWQGTSDRTEGSACEAGESVICNKVSGTLDASYYKGQGMRQGIECEFVADLGMSWDGSDTCFTLTANNANGAQRMPDKENLSCVLSAVGIDAYNQSVTGEVSKPLTAAATDSDHIPLVL